MGNKCGTHQRASGRICGAISPHNGVITEANIGLNENGVICTATSNKIGRGLQNTKTIIHLKALRFNLLHVAHHTQKQDT